MIALWLDAHPWVMVAIFVASGVACGLFGALANGERSYRAGWRDCDDERDHSAVEMAAMKPPGPADPEPLTARPGAWCDDEPLSPPPPSHPVWRNSRLKSPGPAMVPGESPGQPRGLVHETAGPGIDARVTAAERKTLVRPEAVPLSSEPPTVVHPTAILPPLPSPDSEAAERLAGPNTLARGMMAVRNQAFEMALPEGWRQ